MPDDVTNRPWRKHTQLGAIFQKIPADVRHKWAHITAENAITHGKTKDNALLGLILMACAPEQMLFLASVYDEMHPDAELQDAFASLIKTGTFIDVMDHRDPLHRQRVLIAYSAIMQTRGKL